MTILGLLVTLLALQGLPQQAPSASIEGVVVKLGTNEPIAGAYVELSKYEVFTVTQAAQTVLPSTGEAPSVFNATTSDDGRFIFRDLPAGRYRLVATRSGTSYIPVEYGQRDPKGRGAAIVLAAGQRIADIQLRMAVTGAITGRVVDSDGEPVGNARVMALEPRYRDGRRVLNIVQAVRSNDLGEYRLFWLRPGRYYVAVKREDQRNLSFSVHIASPEAFGIREDASSPVVTERKLDDGRTVEETDVVVYYGGGADEQKAQAIDVHAGATVSAIDISTADSRVQTRRIKGVLLNPPGGQPTGEALVRLVPRLSSAHAIIANTTADKQGAFNIGGVVPGSYYLSATIGAGRGFNFTESIFEIGGGVGGLIPIDVAENDLENLTVPLKPAYSLPGRLYFEGGSAANNSFDVTKVRVSLSRNPDLLGLPQSQNRLSRPGQSPSGVPSANGAFTLSGFGAGEYRVNVIGIPQTAYIKAIRLGPIDVLNGGLKVENPPEGQLDILIDIDGGSLTGVTLNEKSEPVVNAIVVVVPDTTLRGMQHLYKHDSTDTSGRFDIKGIAPGEYKAFAFEFIEAGAWQNSELLQMFETRGTPIRFEGSVRQLQLTVIPQAR